MLYIICHQGNANEDNNESCHSTPIRKAQLQNTDNTNHRWKCAAAGTPIHCWWECKMARPLRETDEPFLVKTKHTLTIGSSNCVPCYLPKWTGNLCSHTKKNLYTDVYSSCRHNCQNLQATKIRFSRWVDKTVEYYSALKSNEQSSHAKTRRELTCIRWRERGQCEKAA